MKAEFTALVQQLITAQGKDALFNITKCKAFLANTQGQNISERRLLQQVVESGITSGIANASNIAAYKAQAVQKLQTQYYLAPNVANGVVDVLIGLIRTPPSAPVQQPAYQAPVQQVVRQPQYQQPVNQQAPQSPSIPQPIYQQINISAPHAQNQSNIKLRHGFASFWLWLCFIGNLLGSLLIIVPLVFENDLQLAVFVNDLQTTAAAIYCVAGSVCFWGILHWKKWGFWGLVLIQIGSLMVFEFRSDLIIVYAIHIGIIWGILHFRNAFNAKTAWEQME